MKATLHVQPKKKTPPSRQFTPRERGPLVGEDLSDMRTDTLNFPEPDLAAIPRSGGYSPVNLSKF